MITLRFRDSVVYLTSFVKQQASEKECDPHETFLSQHQTHPSADPGHPAHHSPGRLRRVQHPGSLHRHRRAGCLRPDQRRDGQDAHRAQNSGGLFLRHWQHQGRGRDPVEDPVCRPVRAGPPGALHRRRPGLARQGQPLFQRARGRLHPPHPPDHRLQPGRLRHHPAGLPSVVG